MSADLAPTEYLHPTLEEHELDVQESSPRNSFFYNFNSRSLALYVYQTPLLSLEEGERDVQGSSPRNSFFFRIPTIINLAFTPFVILELRLKKKIPVITLWNQKEAKLSSVKQKIPRKKT